MAGQDQTPALSDFSKEAVRKVVVREGLGHPLTLYPLGLGFLGGLAGLLFASPVFLAAGLGGVLVAAASGVVNIFFRDRALADRYLMRLHKAQEKHEAEIKKSLRDELAKCRKIRAVKKQAQRGLEQYDRALEKFQNVNDLLDSKVTTGELAFHRFISAAQQVYLSVLDNLQQTVDVLKSAGTIDLDFVKRRLKELERQEAGPAGEQERQTLKERLDLLERQLAEADRLLAANEQAMTSLENTTSSLASLDTQGRFAATDYDTAIGYLQELGQGTEKLSRSPRKKEEVEA